MENRKNSTSKGENFSKAIKICHMAVELAPLAKVGGLADVVYGLARQTAKLGHSVSVIIPKYDILLFDEVQDFVCLDKEFSIEFCGRSWSNRVWTGLVGDLRTYFIEPLHPSYYFTRGCIYGCEDDVERFLYFSKAAWVFAEKELKPNLYHIHDWQTCGAALFGEEEKRKKGSSTPFLLTLHNVDYQGRCAPNELEKIGLNPHEYYVPGIMQDTIYPEALNLLRGGIYYSDIVTTVSLTYAKEVQETELGIGLQSLIRDNRDKFSGILNGIDFEYWNPETDKFLPVHYSSRETPEGAADRDLLSSKGYLKKCLRQRMGLEEVHRPIVGAICRLVPQKGVEIIRHAMESVVEMGGQFVLLGSSPIATIDEEFHSLKRYYADHPHIGLALQHQEPLARLIYAGSDLFIVPSNFEPCGLTQLISLRYGTIPLVRKTGGLIDTIFDCDNDQKEEGKASGYTFLDPTNEAFDEALGRAIQCYFHAPGRFRKMIVDGMNQDFSWKKPAEQYVKLYQKLI